MSYLLGVLGVLVLVVSGLLVVVIIQMRRDRLLQIEFNKLMFDRNILEHNYETLVEDLLEPSGCIMGSVSSIQNLNFHLHSLPDNAEKKRLHQEMWKAENQLNQLLLRAINRRGRVIE